MSTPAVAAVVAAVLALLAALHVFWALGGRAGAVAVLPEVRGAPAFTPSAASCWAVAAALALAAYVVLAQGGLAPRLGPAWVVRVAAVVLGAVFVLRAIGDLRLVGFFKKVRGTRFARWDGWLFSPLCLALGLAVSWLALLAPPR